MKFRVPHSVILTVSAQSCVWVEVLGSMVGADASACVESGGMSTVPNGGGKFYFAQEHTDRTDEKIFLAALMLTQFRINNKLLKGL